MGNEAESQGHLVIHWVFSNSSDFFFFFFNEKRVFQWTYVGMQLCVGVAVYLSVMVNCEKTVN